MLKNIAIFVILIGAVAYNAALAVHSEGILVASSLSADRWTRNCSYYTPATVFVRQIRGSDACPWKTRV